MVTKVCLDNIAKEYPPVYCGDSFCNAIQSKLDKYCAINGFPCNRTVPQNNAGEDCWCCCDCATADMPVEVSPGEHRLIETLEVGDTVLATGGRMTGWKARKVSEIGDLPAGAPRDDFYAVGFALAGGEDRSMVAMGDQLFLTPSGSLKPVRDLRPGECVVQADGRQAIVASVALDSFGGGVRTISLGRFDPSSHPSDPYRGHLINLFGLVTADLAVQTAFYADDAGRREKDDDDR